MLASGKTGEGAYARYSCVTTITKPMTATWTRNLCTITGCSVDKVSFDMTYSYGFKGLSIHIARFHCQSRTGGGAYSRDKNTSAGSLAENGRGAYT